MGTRPSSPGGGGAHAEKKTWIVKLCSHLHLQDRFESGPTWRVHELRAERGVFRCCNAAEKGEFVLLLGTRWSVTILRAGASVAYFA